MCKSPNRLQNGLQHAVHMLMPDELHNWLLFRDLRADFQRFQYRPGGRPKLGFWNGFSIPQSFPQAGRRVTPLFV